MKEIIFYCFNENLMKTFIDILVGYMTIAVLATQMNLAEKPFWVHFLEDKHMRILMIFAGAQAACSNWKASILATYLYYLTLDNNEAVLMFIRDIPRKKSDESPDEDHSETKDEVKEDEDPLKMFF